MFHLPALLAHPILHISRIRVNSEAGRRLGSFGNLSEVFKLILLGGRAGGGGGEGGGRTATSRVVSLPAAPTRD